MLMTRVWKLIEFGSVVFGWLLLDRQLHSGQFDWWWGGVGILLLALALLVPLPVFVRNWPKPASLASLFTLGLVGLPLFVVGVVVELGFRSGPDVGALEVTLRLSVHGVALVALCLGAGSPKPRKDA